MTTPAKRVTHASDEAPGLRYERLRQAIASAALEGIRFTAEDLAELTWFDQQGMTDEEAIAYLVSKYRQPE